MNHLKVRSCLIDGEVACCDERGLATFQLLRHRRKEPQAFLYAFDLLELNAGEHLRKGRPGVCLNEHLEHDWRTDGLPARLQDGAGG